MVASANRLSTPARLIIGFLVIAVALLVFFEFRPSGGQDVNNSLASRISIRQDSGNVQWKLPGGDWQTITAVSTLTGQAGKNGKDGADGQAGENGKDGQDGKNGSNGVDGANGANGKDGTNGADGKDGANGSDGAQGATGATGAQGEQGVAGQDGQDGADGIDGINGADGADGTDGREIELQKDLLYIQWRYVGDPTWTNLIAYSDLKGDKGDKGDIGATGPANTLSIGSVTKPSDCTPAASITGTAPNQVLNLGIPGLPNGGATGQVLTKNSGADCDAVWANTNVIVGAGRPDVSASMDAGTQAKVASATSGTEFRSTDGPQGAWVWMKQGSSWVVTQGDTGDVALAIWGATGISYQATDLLLDGVDPQSGVTGGIWVRRVGQQVNFMIERATTSKINPTIAYIPSNFIDSGAFKTIYANGLYGGGTAIQPTVYTSNTNRRITFAYVPISSNIPSAAANQRMVLSWVVYEAPWPTTLSF